MDPLSASSEGLAMIPGLPDELAMLCLARLPWGLHSHARRVSKAWRDALRPATVNSVRRRVGISEQWLAVCINTKHEDDRDGIVYVKGILLLDPLLDRCQAVHLPSPLREIPCHMLELNVMAGAHNELLVTAFDASKRRAMQEMLCLDAVGRQWGPLPAPSSMAVHRLMPAHATLDRFVYAAGGYNPNTNIHTKCAERFNLSTRQWEALPDMAELHPDSVGVALNGFFYVFGGEIPEFWDPRRGEWILAPEMWPQEMWVARRPLLTVMKDQLYAFNGTSSNEQLSRQLMCYDKKNKRWISLGRIPADCFPDASVYHVIAVGDELWVTLRSGKGMYMLATKPNVQPLSWKQLPFPFNFLHLMFTAVVITV